MTNAGEHTYGKTLTCVRNTKTSIQILNFPLSHTQ